MKGIIRDNITNVRNATVVALNERADDIEAHLFGYDFPQALFRERVFELEVDGAKVFFNITVEVVRNEKCPNT